MSTKSSPNGQKTRKRSDSSLMRPTLSSQAKSNDPNGSPLRSSPSIPHASPIPSTITSPRKEATKGGKKSAIKETPSSKEAKRQPSPSSTSKTVKPGANSPSSQSSKGSRVKVLIRVRAQGKYKTIADLHSGLKIGADNATVQVPRDLDGKAGVMYETIFSFSRVYGPATPTETLHTDFTKDLVRSACQGTNGLCFVYGQTNSGKTYTMHANGGLIRLATQELFARKADMERGAEGKDRRMMVIKVQFLEIYNDDCRDLLSSAKNQVEIKSNGGKDVYVGLSEHKLTSLEHASKLQAEGNRRKIQKSTKGNDMSSRSHTVFRFNIRSIVVSSDGKNSKGGRKKLAETGKKGDSKKRKGEGAWRWSQLDFVDLAGSEPLPELNQAGQITERKSIVESLVALKRVMLSLSVSGLKDSPSGFTGRDCNLTRVLKDSLTGHGKIVLIATISPEPADSGPTKQTLSFAELGRKITSEAKRNQATGDDELEQLQNEVEEMEEIREQMAKTKKKTEGLKHEQGGQRQLSALEMKEIRQQIDSLLQTIKNKDARLRALAKREKTDDWTDVISSLQTELKELRASIESLKASLRPVDEEENHIAAEAELAANAAAEQRQKEEEEARLQDEEERQRKVQAEAEKAEEDARRAEEDARRAEEDAQRAEEDARRAEEDARRAEEDDARRAEEDDARRAEEDARKAEEDDARRAVEDARKAEEDDARRAEEDARRAEEDHARRAEEHARKAEEDDARRAEEDARKAEEDARKAKEKEEKEKKEKEEKERKAKEEKEKKEKEEKEKKEKEEQERKKKEKEEQARREREAAEEAARLAAEEAERERREAEQATFSQLSAPFRRGDVSAAHKVLSRASSLSVLRLHGENDGVVLIAAMASGREINKALLEALRENKFDLNAAQRREKTAVQVAAQENSLEALGALLSCGAQPDALAVELAIAHGHSRAVELCFKYGADPKMSLPQSLSDVMPAAVKHTLDPPCLQSLLESEVDPNGRDSEGRTPLHVLVSLRSQTNYQLQVLQLLKGLVDLQAKDKQKRTALMVAIKEQQADAVSAWLIEATDAKKIDEEDGEGDSTLYQACWYEQKTAVARLISRGADVNKTNRKAWSCLHATAYRGFLPISRMLVDAKAMVDPQSHEETTPLFHACDQGHDESMEFLIALGAQCGPPLDHPHAWSPLQRLIYKKRWAGARRMLALTHWSVGAISGINHKASSYTVAHFLIEACACSETQASPEICACDGPPTSSSSLPTASSLLRNLFVRHPQAACPLEGLTSLFRLALEHDKVGCCRVLLEFATADVTLDDVKYVLQYAPKGPANGAVLYVCRAKAWSVPQVERKSRAEGRGFQVLPPPRSRDEHGEYCRYCAQLLDSTEKNVHVGEEVFHSDCFTCAADGIVLDPQDKVVFRFQRYFCDAVCADSMTCLRCSNVLTAGATFIRDESGRRMHASCFTCQSGKCSPPNVIACASYNTSPAASLRILRSALRSYFTLDDGTLACKPCYTSTLPTCTVCKEHMNSWTTLSDGRKYHKECFKCRRCQTPIKGSYYDSDGGFLCTPCS
eukprot:g83272.t1